ncbi:hypothetical protein HC928_05915 [bacterium]|nr:hypothetical protein [bacterium]
MTNVSREHFARKLTSVFDRFEDREFDVENYSDIIMRAFLAFGSETPDNENCVRQLEYKQTEQDDNPYRRYYGFTLKQSNIPVHFLLNKLEGMPVPASIKDAYPDLSQEEWDAALRMATMIVAAFSPIKYNR